MNGYTFCLAQQVQFTAEAKHLFDGDPDHTGVFTVTKIAAIPKTCNDPFSPDYMGEQEGQDAVGHHQSVQLAGRDGWVSGALIEPAVL